MPSGFLSLFLSSLYAEDDFACIDRQNSTKCGCHLRPCLLVIIAFCCCSNTSLMCGVTCKFVLSRIAMKESLRPSSILTPWVPISSSILFSRSCSCSHFSSESFNFILSSFTVSCNFTCEHAVNGALAFAGSVGLADFLFSSNLVHVFHFSHASRDTAFRSISSNR